MIEARTLHHTETCACGVKNSSCKKKATVELMIDPGDELGTAVAMCTACAKEVFNALGFCLVSVTGESVARLVGLSKRKGDKR